MKQISTYRRFYFNFFLSLQNKFVMFSVQQKHKSWHIISFLDIEIMQLFTAPSDDCQQQMAIMCTAKTILMIMG